MTLRHAAIAFLTAEAVLGAAWWISLAVDAGLRSRFFPAELPHAVLGALAVADILLFVVGAAIAAIALARRAAVARALMFLHAGGALYAGSFAIALSLFDGDLWLGGVLMLPSTVLAPWLAWQAPRLLAAR